MSDLSDDTGVSRTDAGVKPLLDALGSAKGLERQRARQALVEIGQPAVPGLIAALSSANNDERWGAAKALSEIRDPSAAQALVPVLEDREFGIRWLAAEALIGLRRDALIPVLKALITRSTSVWLREGAHHILRTIAKQEDLGDVLNPVLAAINSTEPADSTPVAAGEALKTLYGL